MASLVCQGCGEEEAAVIIGITADGRQLILGPVCLYGWAKQYVEMVDGADQGESTETPPGSPESNPTTDQVGTSETARPKRSRKPRGGADATLSDATEPVSQTAPTDDDDESDQAPEDDPQAKA